MFSCDLLFYQHNLSLDLVHVNLLCKTMMYDFDGSIDDFYHCIFKNDENENEVDEQRNSKNMVIKMMKIIML